MLLLLSGSDAVAQAGGVPPAYPRRPLPVLPYDEDDEVALIVAALVPLLRI